MQLTDTISEITVHSTEQSMESTELQKELDDDLDRGIKRFAQLYSIDKELLTTLFKQKIANEKNLKKLYYWKVRWNRSKWINIAIAAFSLFFSFTAETLDQIFDPQDESQRITRSVIVISAAAVVVISSVFAAISWCLSGRKYEQYKALNDLNDLDKEAVKKFRIVLDAWGTMERSKEAGILEENRDPDLHEKTDICLKTIQELPKNIKEIQIPSKSRLASETIGLCDENHPLKKIVNILESQEMPLGSAEGSFNDLGQQDVDVNQENVEGARGSINNTAHWLVLQHHLGGLKLTKIYCNGRVLINPLYSDEYYRLPNGV